MASTLYLNRRARSVLGMVSWLATKYNDAAMAIARYNLTPVSNMFHVYSRGVEKRTIFLGKRDYARFRRKIFEYSAQESTKLYCFCLLPNHFHLLLYCDDIGALSKVLHRLLTSHAMYFNIRHERVGHLFQGRFHVRAIDSEKYLGTAVEYIKSNAPHSKYPWLFVSKDCP